MALGLFRPASVQREYQWTRGNCETLLADLRRVLDPPRVIAGPALVSVAAQLPPAAASPPSDDILPADEGEARIDPTLIPQLAPTAEPPVQHYFLGTMVVRPGSGGRIDVYDGLQRLTTLTIVMSVLRDITQSPDLAARLNRLIVASGANYRLTLRTGGQILTQEIQKPGEAGKARRYRANLNDTEYRIRAVAAYVHGQLMRWSPEQVEGFALRLLQQACVGLTEVTDDRVARQIFVSTNLHGVRLNRVDLFKGQLMDLAPDAAAGDRIAAAWARISNQLGDDVGDFLVAMDFIERRQPQSEDCLTSLAAHLERTSPGDAILGWVENLEGFARASAEMQGRIDRLGTGAAAGDIWKLRFFWWSEWRPLALLWYRDHMSKRDKDGRAPPATQAAFERRFSALHGRCLAIMLADFTPGERAMIFGNAIGQTRSGANPLVRALAFNRNALDKMRQSLLVPMTDDGKRHATVRWIEASLWGDAIPDYLGRATVEHVLPQRTREGSQWRVAFPDEEVRYDCAHSLGNLACLDSARNGAIANSDYLVKQAAYLDSPEFKMIAQIAVLPEWTPATIRAREQQLTDYVFATLHLPEFSRARTA
jgi:hypothetical protein